jgi:hypothetical protein
MTGWLDRRIEPDMRATERFAFESLGHLEEHGNDDA